MKHCGICAVCLFFQRLRQRDAVGLVPQDLLVGRAGLVVWSTDGSAEWIKPWTWFSAARWARIGGTL